jgi:hypothetical protein
VLHCHSQLQYFNQFILVRYCILRAMCETEAYFTLFFFQLIYITSTCNLFINFQGRAGTCPPISHSKHLSPKQKLPSDSDIENYAQQHLNKHKKGLFGKNVPLTNMLKWSKVC